MSSGEGRRVRPLVHCDPHHTLLILEQAPDRTFSLMFSSSRFCLMWSSVDKARVPPPSALWASTEATRRGCWLDSGNGAPGPSGTCRQATHQLLGRSASPKWPARHRNPRELSVAGSTPPPARPPRADFVYNFDSSQPCMGREIYFQRQLGFLLPVSPPLGAIQKCLCEPHFHFTASGFPWPELTFPSNQPGKKSFSRLIFILKCLILSLPAFESRSPTPRRCYYYTALSSGQGVPSSPRQRLGALQTLAVCGLSAVFAYTLQTVVCAWVCRAESSIHIVTLFCRRER